MPPISRIEDGKQIRRCTRVRQTLRKSLDTLFAPYYHAFKILKPHAFDVDVEKYFDVYEISRIDVEDAEVIAAANPSESDGPNSLQDLKLSLQKLHVVRKMFLCTLLALNADGGKADFSVWSTASDAMQGLADLSNSVVCGLDEVLGEEEGRSNHTPITHQN